jgi:hypothetical protein
MLQQNVPLLPDTYRLKARVPRPAVMAGTRGRDRPRRVIHGGVTRAVVLAEGAVAGELARVDGVAHVSPVAWRTMTLVRAGDILAGGAVLTGGRVTNALVYVLLTCVALVTCGQNSK